MGKIEERYLDLDKKKIEEARAFKEMEAARYSEHLELIRRNILEIANAIALKLESYDAKDHCWVSLDGELYVSWIVVEGYRNSETKRRFDVYLLSNGLFAAWNNKEEPRETARGFDKLLPAVIGLDLESNLEDLFLVLDGGSIYIEKFQHKLLHLAEEKFNVKPKTEWYTKDYPPPALKSKSRLRILLENLKSMLAQRKPSRL